MGLHSEAALDRRYVQFAAQLNIYLNHFPKHEKYGLAQHIRVACYDVYALIIEAQKRYHKKTVATNLDVRHEQLRMLIRLAYEMGYFGCVRGSDQDDARALKRYVHISERVDEIGRMIGGWLREIRSDTRDAP